VNELDQEINTMRLYIGSSTQFIEDVTQHAIAEKMSRTFFEYYHYYPSDNERRSWHNSLRALQEVFKQANLLDHGIILESQLPLTSKRLDCLICGKDANANDKAIVIELKQWDSCTETDGPNEVVTYVGGAQREVLHPSAQVGGYKLYLEDTQTVYYEGSDAVELNGCCFLHNYSFSKNDPLLAEKFNILLNAYPIFTSTDTNSFSTYLKEKLETGKGTEVLDRIEKSKYKPSKKLLDHVSNIIKSKSDYILLDEQRIVYDKVFTIISKGFDHEEKSVIIIKGGPGTGKSVIALNLVGDLSSQGINAQYATGSKAFTETLRSIVDRRSEVQFKYFNSYQQAANNQIDVIICDEAHRIRKVSYDRFTPAHQRSSRAQIRELIDSARVSIFFIDDDQIVRPNEVGSVDYILTHAKALNATIHEYELEAQFRCNGSDAFVNWINNTLEVKSTANVIWDNKDSFDFKIFNHPLDLEQAIQEKVKQGNTGRLTAGFCWPWSDPDSNGGLINDVVIGNFSRPWNAKPDTKRKLAAGIPKSSLWAYQSGGINQIGCIYTAQGFEFDYVGVIFGKDMVYRFGEGWVGNKEESKDSVVKKSGAGFLDLVKNTYRVLLSRGMKGCYVHFLDTDTEKYFNSRIAERTNKK